MKNILIISVFNFFLILGCDYQSSENQVGESDVIQFAIDENEDIKNFIRGISIGDLNILEQSFSEEVMISGALGALEGGEELNWKVYKKEDVVEQYRILQTKTPGAMANLSKIKPLIQPVSEYTGFPDSLDVKSLESSDIVLDFRASENLYNEKRVVFDDAPISVFRKSGDRYLIIAQFLVL